MFGLVSVRERIWKTRAKKYARLLPEGIGVRPRGRSRRLERVLTDFGCEHSFAQASARVREHYGFEVSVSAVRETTLKHAQRASQKLEEQYEKPFRLLPAVGAEQVVAEEPARLVAGLEHDGARSVSKQDTGISIGEIGDLRQGFDADHQHIAQLAISDELIGNRHGKEKSSAGRGDVEGRDVLATELFLQKYGTGRNWHVGGNRTDYDHVKVSGGQLRGLQGSFGRLQRHIARGLAIGGEPS